MTGNRRCKITYPMSRADRCIGDAITSGASNVAATRDMTGRYSKIFLLYVRRHTQRPDCEVKLKARLSPFQDRPRPHAGNVAHGNRTGWPRKPSSDGK